MQEPENIEYKEIIRRLQQLEHHVINLIIPMQSLTKLLCNTKELQDIIAIFRDPIKIDDKALLNGLTELEKQVKAAGLFDLAQNLAEIKFIGAKMHDIAGFMGAMKEQGINKKVTLQFQCDGYELVKKPISYDPDEPLADPNEKYKKIKKFMDSTEWNVISLRLGLVGGKSLTYKAIGSQLNIPKERVSRLYRWAMSKLWTKEGLKCVKDSGCELLQYELRDYL